MAIGKKQALAFAGDSRKAQGGFRALRAACRGRRGGLQGCGLRLRPGGGPCGRGGGASALPACPPAAASTPRDAGGTGKGHLVHLGPPPASPRSSAFCRGCWGTGPRPRPHCEGHVERVPGPGRTPGHLGDVAAGGRPAPWSDCPRRRCSRCTQGGRWALGRGRGQVGTSAGPLTPHRIGRTGQAAQPRPTPAPSHGTEEAGHSRR